MIKRVFDLVCAGLGVIVCAPLFAVIAASVRLSSPGPIFFCQTRIGRGARPFTIVKFRTMHRDAPATPPVTVAGDPRITPFGRFLRRTKLDELPQLLNVVRGDMSLVGPRPEVPEFVDRFKDDYAEILRVRPGITDEASLQFRKEEQLLAASSNPRETYVNDILPRKIEMAKHYVRTRNLGRDLIIIARTILHV